MRKKRARKKNTKMWNNDSREESVWGEGQESVEDSSGGQKEESSGSCLFHALRGREGMERGRNDLAPFGLTEASKDWMSGLKEGRHKKEPPFFLTPRSGKLNAQNLRVVGGGER